MTDPGGSSPGPRTDSQRRDDLATTGADATADRDPPDPGSGTRQVERLDRGLVALARDGGDVLLRWRLFADDPDGVAFHVSRDGERLTDDPVTGATNYVDEAGNETATYAVTPVVDGEEGSPSREADVVTGGYVGIDLDSPGPRDGVGYWVKDACVGDLDGDGRYEFVVKWFPEDANGPPGKPGYTGEAFLDAYRRDGTRLWRIGLGPNLSASNYALPICVYDFDGDGKSEVAFRAVDGTTMGDGTVVGDPDARHLGDTDGRLTAGPEYLAVAEGETGATVATTAFEPHREPITSWGDDRNQRAGHVHLNPAYLDGARPSLVSSRGVYDRMGLVAWDLRDGELTRRWTFDTDDGHPEYAGQGNHTVSVADVDDDGRDEIVYGACVIDHDGTGLHTTGLGHGDALHVSDFDPSRDGQEVWQPHEPEDAEYGATLRDAETGEILFGQYTGVDTGRGMIADLDPDRPGCEFWAPAGVGTHSMEAGYPRVADALDTCNFGVWWTGSLQRELFDGGAAPDSAGRVYTWDPAASDGDVETVTVFEGTRTTQYTKRFPTFLGDVLGDWREEVLLTDKESTELRIYLTPHETEHRIPNLLHDTQYRQAMAWQPIGYSQPPWPSFHLGTGMDGAPDHDVRPV